VIETVSLPAVRRRSGQGLPRNRHTLALIPEPSIWALSAPATLRTRQARAATCVSTRAGPGRAPGAQACLRAHLCGVGSHGEAWQEPRCQEPRTRCPEQWEPALIGKTRQDRAWHRSQRRTNFHSPSPPLFFWTGFSWSAFRCGTFTKSPSQCFTWTKAVLFFIKERLVDQIRAKLLSPSPLKSGKVQKHQMLLSKNINKRFIFTFNQC
jgi:hypothetical protein